jgi:hypothetical protein
MHAEDAGLSGLQTKSLLVSLGKWLARASSRIEARLVKLQSIYY